MLSLAVLVSGCNKRLLEVYKPDGTIIRVKLDDGLSDKAVGDLEVEIDPATGVYRVRVKGYRTETSPILSDTLKAIYEAGMKAGAAGI